MVKNLNIISWMGGKYYLADWIVKHMPYHNLYCEPFGGAMNVLLQKKPSYIEVYNDVNLNLVNLYSVAKYKPKSLSKVIKNTLYSRYLHDKYRNLYINHQDKFLQIPNIKRAAIFMLLINSSINGLVDGSFSTSTCKNQSTRFHNKGLKLNKLSKRLQCVIIENLDFVNVITKYDKDDTFFYLDPPYFMGGEYYNTDSKFGFTEHDHIRLANCLNKIKGKACISYYDNELIEKYYNGWYIANNVVTKSSSNNITKGNELLLMNYKPKNIKCERV